MSPSFDPLARLAFSIADPADTETAAAIGDALTAGHPPDAIAEAILQGIPYSGFPGAVEALGALKDVCEARGVGREFRSRASRVAPSEETPPAFLAVYRHGSDAVRGALRDRHPDLERWILDFAYGEVMGRDRLSLEAMEGLAVASLLAQRRRTPLHSHLRGALRNGWTKGALADLLRGLESKADPETLAFARATLARETEK